jgi:hypothetical protein
MAQVTSSKDMTVIVLDNDESNALADLLYMNGESVLDELTNTMLTDRFEPVTSYDKPEPPWKDEPSSDYRFGRG